MKCSAKVLGISLVILLAVGLAGATDIYDIQFTTDPSGNSPLVGQTVTITGLVTAEGYAFGGAYYFVQDADPPWSGIRVDDPNRAVAEGDEVTLTGTVAEVDGMTAIQSVTSFAINSSGNILYDPLGVTTGSLGAEANEGCLMKVEDVTVADPGPGCADFSVDDGSGACTIGAEAEWYHWPQAGEQLAYVIGVVNLIEGEFKLEPRLTRDITPPGRARTIQWVQQVRYSDLIALNDASYAVGDTVEVRGIVTMPTGLSYAGAGVKFIYEDTHGGPWSGIMSYDSDSSAFPTLFEGDSVRVVGYVSEYETSPSIMTEIFITEEIEYWFDVGTHEEPILPTGTFRWPTTAEQWGTVMVKIQDAVVTVNNLPYNEWKVDDGSGSVNVDDDSDSLSGFIRPPVGTPIAEIRGWIYHHYGDYGDSTTYKLEPLYLTDIVIGSGPPDIISCVREPGVPQQGDPVYLVCEITDDSIVDSAWVYYRVNGGTFQRSELEFTGGFYWEGEIPEMMTGDWVDYFITAIDDSGEVGIEPPDTSSDMFCYPVTAGAVLSMEDVQYTPWPSGNSPFNGYEVTVEGVVTADTATYVNWEAYALQDAAAPWSGIFVSWISNQLVRGQQVQVTGTVTEVDPEWTYKWGGLTKLIDCTDVTLTGTGTEPDPLSLSTWDLSADNLSVEQYEGLLVTVSDVQVTSVNQYDWTIDDGSGGCLMDDDASSLDSLFGLITPGSTFERVSGFFCYSFGTYKIELRDAGDYAGFVGVKDYQPPVAYDFSIEPNYPNPFNLSTRINYMLPRTLPVKIVVYNIMGQQVKSLVNGTQIAGPHFAVWDGTNTYGKALTSGVYIYRIKAGDYIESHKMVLLK